MQHLQSLPSSNLSRWGRGGCLVDIDASFPSRGCEKCRWAKRQLSQAIHTQQQQQQHGWVCGLGQFPRSIDAYSTARKMIQWVSGTIIERVIRGHMTHQTISFSDCVFRLSSGVADCMAGRIEHLCGWAASRSICELVPSRLTILWDSLDAALFRLFVLTHNPCR
jgi:hypothetical protein